MSELQVNSIVDNNQLFKVTKLNDSQYVVEIYDVNYVVTIRNNFLYIDNKDYFEIEENQYLQVFKNITDISKSPIYINWKLSYEEKKQLKKIDNEYYFIIIGNVEYKIEVIIAYFIRNINGVDTKFRIISIILYGVQFSEERFITNMQIKLLSDMIPFQCNSFRYETPDCEYIKCQLYAPSLTINDYNLHRDKNNKFIVDSNDELFKKFKEILYSMKLDDKTMIFGKKY